MVIHDVASGFAALIISLTELHAPQPNLLYALTLVLYVVPPTILAEVYTYVDVELEGFPCKVR